EPVQLGLRHTATRNPLYTKTPLHFCVRDRSHLHLRRVSSISLGSKKTRIAKCADLAGALVEVLVLPQGACLLQLLAASAFGNTVCNVVHRGKDDEEVEEEDGLGALLQRSDDAVEERLRRVLRKGIGSKDFEAMDEVELQAVAEQEEIANVIQTIGASGKLALAWVFIKKLGSLKRAFKWFDTRNTRKIPQVVWDTGFQLLHIDAERLTGWRPFDIFKQIDTDPSDGTISYKEWNNFFADAAKTIALEMESLGGIDFEQQVKLRRHNLKMMRDRRRGKNGRAEDSWLEDLSEKQAMKQQEEEFTKRVRSKLKSIGEGQSFLFGREWLCTAEEALLLLTPLKRSDIVQQEAESLRLWSIPSPALIDVREMLKFRPGLTSQDQKPPEYSLQPVMEMPQDKTKADKNGDPGSILVTNLTEFTQEIQEKLKDIPIHCSEEFPTSLSDLQRGVVKLIAQRMGLVAAVETIGALLQMTVFNVSGDFVKDMQKQLGELEEGQGMRLSRDLSEEERHLVKAMAAEMGYAVSETSMGIEVTNLRAYAKQIREEFSELGVGETRRIALSSSTDEQLVMLQKVAQELGLDWDEEGQRRQRTATVGNMVHLVDEMREKLTNTTTPGTVLSFILPPTEPQQDTFFEMAQNYGFECISKENTEKGVRAYLRRLSFERTSLAARRRRNSISATTPKGEGMQLGLGETAPLDPLEKDARPDDDGLMEDSGLEEESEEEAQEPQEVPEAEESAEEDSPEPSELKEDDLSELLLMRGLQSGEDHLIPRVFRRYASGNWRGKVLFLRYGDVKDFAEDLKYVTPNVDTRLYRFTGMFEYLFEDTLQLQIDMGVRVGQGLTIEWFQIFLQKVIARLGKQFVPVLFQLLDE
ncbi:SEC1A, partial [Symbiodinium pilosum]